MIEGEAVGISEDKILGALKFAGEALGAVMNVQKELCQKIGKAKVEIKLSLPEPALVDKVKELAKERLTAAYGIADKTEREQARDKLLQELTADRSIFDGCKKEEKDEKGKKGGGRLRQAA